MGCAGFWIRLVLTQIVIPFQVGSEYGGKAAIAAYFVGVIIDAIFYYFTNKKSGSTVHNLLIKTLNDQKIDASEEERHQIDLKIQQARREARQVSFDPIAWLMDEGGLLIIVGVILLIVSYNM